MSAPSAAFVTWMLALGVAAALAAAWLSFWHPDSRIHPGMAGARSVLPSQLAGGAFVFLTIAALVHGIARFAATESERAWRALVHVSLLQPRGMRAGGLIAIGSLGAVLAFDWAGFQRGFFRLDDFEYLRVVREEPLGRQLLLPHGGHSIPLLRLEMFALARIGTAPNPAIFNAANLASCAALLAAGCWLLAELGVGWTGLVAFAGFNWLWPGWGDFTSGYFCMMNSTQGLALGFVALAALLHAAATGTRKWLLLALAAGGVAVGVGLANVWILPALLAFAAVALGRRESSPLVAPFLFGFAVLISVFAAYNFAVFRHGEFVAGTIRGSMDAVGLLRSMVSGLGGVIVNAFAPVQVGALNAGGAAYAVELAVLAIAVTAVVRWTRADEANGRRPLLALGSVMLVQVAMVAVARRSDGAGIFWPAKWSAAAHCTFALIAAILLDRQLRGDTSPLRPRTGRTAALGILGIGVALGTPALLDAMGSPVSRANNVRHAISRRAEFARFEAAARKLAELAGRRPVVLPPCRIERLNAAFPKLEGYTLAHYASALPGGLLVVDSTTAGLDPALLRALRQVPDLRSLYPETAP